MTKDLSRFGRDHIMVGYYLEYVFPEKQVRYIAGIVLPVISSILLLLSGRTALCKWPPIALLLLAAGLVWECLAPLWKPGAVFDWWDFPAYQLGGLLYWLFSRGKFHQNYTENR